MTDLAPKTASKAVLIVLIAFACIGVVRDCSAADLDLDTPSAPSARSRKERGPYGGGELRGLWPGRISAVPAIGDQRGRPNSFAPWEDARPPRPTPPEPRIGAGAAAVAPTLPPAPDHIDNINHTTQPPAQSFSFLQLVLLALGVIGLALGIANIPHLVRFIDGLFEPSSDDPSVDGGLAGLHAGWASDAPAGSQHVSGSALSAAELRSHTELLRTLAEQLGAQVEAAHATIQQERGRAEQQPLKGESR